MVPTTIRMPTGEAGDAKAGDGRICVSELVKRVVLSAHPKNLAYANCY
jgi:hypothetical protein